MDEIRLRLTQIAIMEKYMARFEVGKFPLAIYH